MSIKVKLLITAFLSAALLIAPLSVTPVFADSDKTIELLNVSYDPTREFYEQYNKVFANYWKKTHKQNVKINQSHGGSSKQARSVIDGLEADVVTLAMPTDIDAIYKIGHLIPANWKTRLKDNSSPYTSTIIFLVRKGNPKNIKDWNDLTKNGVEVITPNPKTSGAARLSYLAAWGYIMKKELRSLDKISDPKAAKEVQAAEKKARAFVTEMYKHVPVLDSGARGSTITFVQRGMGDVLLAWENEAFLAINKLGPDKFDIVTPSLSILAQPSVTVVDNVVNRKKTKEIATEYLNYLYSPEAQELAAKYYYRPAHPELLKNKKLAELFPKLELFTVDTVFKSWADAEKTHFADGGIFDQIYISGR
ncbi:MAG: sulfate ABC transporter substrate-binding protein [Acidobacteria bacterium]|nr:sulfate ABC transporter substrate-binding protein [Acidobacteriota bacterium]